MKKYVVFICFLLILSSHAMAQAPWDIIFHAVPVSPGMDLPEGVQQTVGNLQTTISSELKDATSVKTDLGSSLTSKISKSFDKIKSEAIIETSGNPGQEKSDFCGEDTLKLETKDIAKKIKEVLLTSKSADLSYLTKKSVLKEKFFMDNIYAIHSASLIIQSKLENNIAAKIEEAKSCSNGTKGNGNVPSSVDGGNNEVIFCYGKTLEALESFIRLWESVSALKARLSAVKIINKISPVVNVSDNEKSDKQVFLNRHESVAKIHNLMQIGFAQMDVKNLSSKLNSTNIEKVDAAEIVEKDNKESQYISNKLKFVSPKMNEKENALASLQTQMSSLTEMSEVEAIVSNALYVHNIIGDLPQYKEKAKQYTEMQEDYKKNLEKLVTSEKCAINYLSKYFADPHKVWSGNLPMSNVYKHELRKGISGWAINAFEVFKSGEATDAISAFAQVKEKQDAGSQEDEKAYLTDSDALDKKINQKMSMSGTQPDDIVQETLTEEDVAFFEDDPDFEKAISQNTEEKSNKFINESMSPSKKEVAGEETRKSTLISWQIGAEASKILGDTSNNWGSPVIGTSMVWTDTKRFYKKYLEMKYNNILRYMKSYSEADLLSLIAKKLIGNTQKVTDSNYQINRKKEIENLDEDSKKEMLENISTKNQFRSSFKNKMNQLDKELEILRAKGDDLNFNLRNIKEEINAIKVNESDKNLSAIEMSLTASVEFPKNNEEPSKTKITPLDKQSIFTSLKDTSSKNLATNNELQEKEKDAKGLQDELNIIASKIADKEVEIKKFKLQKQLENAPLDDSENALSSEEELMIKISGADGVSGILSALHSDSKNKSLKTIKDILIKGNDENPIEGFNISTIMNNIETGARQVVLDVHQKVQEIIVEKGLNKLYALGDNLYSETSYQEIEKIHNDMINELRSANFAFTVLDGIVSPLISVKNLYVFAEFLEGVDTSPELEGFFVGSTPKERDLKAPFKLKGFDMPPVREVFHFDAVDFKNVQPEQQSDGSGDEWLENLFQKMGKNKRSISKEDFLEYGGDVPLIWQYILQDFPFIETRLPLKDILKDDSSECENVSFARGGVFPCTYGDGKFVLDINKKSNFINKFATSEHKNLNKCESIINDNGYAKHTFWKTRLHDEVINDEIPPLNCEYSELGMLFEADKHNNLYIKSNVFKNFNRINQKDGKSLDKMSARTKKNLAAAKYSELNRNQIGDFLKHAEREKISRESMEEVKAEYDRSMETIYAIFKECGFTPSKDFYFDNEDDYKQAEKILKEIKKQKIEAAEQLLNNINISNNPPAEEKSQNMKTLIDFMKKDETSLIKLSLVDFDSKDYDARLKKAKADDGLLSKFKEKNEERKKEYNDVEDIYCAIY